MSIGNPRRLRNGMFYGIRGTYWAWPIDGYWDVHHTEIGVEPDGSEVVSEFHATLADARREARELHESDLGVMMKRFFGGRR